MNVSKSKPRLPRVLLLLTAVAVVASAWWLWRSPSSEVRFRSAKLESGDVSVTISATGSLKALSTVDIGSQISGQIAEVRVDFNEQVSQGQVLARIDPANFEARLTQARADLSSARAGLEEAQANLKNAEADFARKTELSARQLVSRSDLDLALAARDQARARVTSARAAIEQRDAAVADAALDLTYAEIRSPVDGVVLLRAAEPGQTVAASFQTPVLFQIAEDLRQMQIELAVDESDVGQIRPGQAARFTVDAFPGRQFRGAVKQVRMAATNTQNVITYPVVIDVDNADLSLLPGMTANATIEVEQRRGVLRVPNAALRFKPPGTESDSAAPATGMARANLDLSEVVAALNLNAPQQAAYDKAAAAARERAAQRAAEAAQRGPGGPPMMSMGGGQAPSPEAIAQMIAKRVLENYAEFTALLTAEQKAAFEAGVLEQLSARQVTLWTLDGKTPTAIKVMSGIADATHTEVRSPALKEGMTILIGTETTTP